MIHKVDTYNSFQYYGVPRYVDIEIPEGYRVLEDGAIINKNHQTLTFDVTNTREWKFKKVACTQIGRENEGFFCTIEAIKRKRGRPSIPVINKVLENLNPILEMEID